MRVHFAMIVPLLCAGCATAFISQDPDPFEPFHLDTAAMASASFSIDLPAVLQLAGARDAQLRLARVAEEEAHTRTIGEVQALFPTAIPFFRAFQHNGLAQPQTGQIVDVDRRNFELQVAGVGYWDPGPVIFGTLAARHAEAAAASRTEAERQAAALRSAFLYLELIRANAREAIARAALASAQELERFERSRERRGAAVSADVLRARAELEDRRQAVLQATADVEKASAALVEELQLPPRTRLVPRDSLPPVLPRAIADETVLELTDRALAMRPEASAALWDVEVARRRRQGATWGSLLPFVSATNAPGLLAAYGIARVGFPRGDSVVGDLKRQDAIAYYVKERDGMFYGPLVPFSSLFLQSGLSGASLGDLAFSQDAILLTGWRIGRGGLLDLPRIQKGQVEEDTARVRKEALDLRIAREVTDARAAAVAAEERVASARRGLEAARESLRVSRDRHERGVAIQLEVLIAERAFVEAQGRMVDALADDARAQLQLSRALGTIPR